MALNKQIESECELFEVTQTYRGLSKCVTSMGLWGPWDSSE